MSEALKKTLFICRRAAFLLLLLFLASPGSRFEASAAENDKVILYYFWGTGCPVCEEAKPFLSGLARRHPQLEIRSYDVMASRENLALWIEMAERFRTRPAGVPSFYIGERAFSGFSPEIAREIEATVLDRTAETVSGEKAVLRIPLFGAVDPEELSLPLFTVLIAALDSFNPCAFFVLLFLLSLLIHVRSRRRMLMIGGTFVLCSGIVYFLFMAAWLNLFLLVGHLRAITTVAGTVALVLGIINAKDFFFFKEGVSLSIPEAAKPKLFARMRGLLKAESPATMLTGALILAVAANSYELLCTAGFPMVFTRVLTLHSLPPEQYYLYLGLYNLVYIVPLAVIVGVFTVTLGRRKMSEWQGRVLKLLSGVMMVFLGGVLLIEPALLNNPLAAAGLLAAALLLTGLGALAAKRGPSRHGRE
jgi:thiol-disulfide isomerase/thioredoxin